MTKSKSLSLKDEKKLLAKLPSWIPEKEDTATAILQTAQEFLLLVEDCLAKHHGFSENEMKKLESEVREMLITLGDMERKGLSILSPREMSIVGEIAEIRRKRLEFGRSGLVLPPVNKSEVIAQLANKKANG